MNREELYIAGGAVVIMTLLLMRGHGSSGGSSGTIYSSGLTGGQAVALAQSSMAMRSADYRTSVAAKLAAENIKTNAAIAKDSIAANLKGTSIKANLLAELEQMQSQSGITIAQISAKNSLAETRLQSKTLEYMSHEAWTSKQAMLSGAEPSTGLMAADAVQKNALAGWKTFTHWFNLSGILGI